MGLVTPLERLLTVPRLRAHVASGRVDVRAAVLRLVDEPLAAAPTLVPAGGGDGHQCRHRLRAGVWHRVGGAALRRQPAMDATHRTIGWRALAVTALVVVPTFVVLGSWWQQILRDLVGLPRAQRSFYILVLLIAVAIALALLAMARGVRRATNWLTGRPAGSCPVRSPGLLRGDRRGAGRCGTRRRSSPRPAEHGRTLGEGC